MRALIKGGFEDIGPGGHSTLRAVSTDGWIFAEF